MEDRGKFKELSAFARFMRMWGNEMVMVCASMVLLALAYQVVVAVLGDPPITASAITEPFWTIMRITIYNAFSQLMSFLYFLRLDKTEDGNDVKPWNIWAVFMLSCSLLGF